jgi:hypothetical protein
MMACRGPGLSDGPRAKILANRYPYGNSVEVEVRALSLDHESSGWKPRTIHYTFKQFDGSRRRLGEPRWPVKTGLPTPA